MSDSIGYYGEGGQAGASPRTWQNLYNRTRRMGTRLTSTNKHHFVGSFVYELPFGQRKEVRQLVEQGRRWCRWAAGSWAASSPRIPASR